MLGPTLCNLAFFPSCALYLRMTLGTSFQLTTILVSLIVFAWPVCEFLEDRCSLTCITSNMIKPILKGASRCYYNTKNKSFFPLFLIKIGQSY